MFDQSIRDKIRRDIVRLQMIRSQTFRRFFAHNRNPQARQRSQISPLGKETIAEKFHRITRCQDQPIKLIETGDRPIELVPT